MLTKCNKCKVNIKTLTWCGVKTIAYNQHLVHLRIKINNVIILQMKFYKI